MVSIPFRRILAYNGYDNSTSELCVEGEIDPKLYSFELRDYVPTPSQDQNLVIAIEGESENTAQFRHHWRSKQVILDHYKSQYENVKRDRYILLERLSRGVGDIPTTMAYMVALKKAEDDMISLKGCVGAYSDEAGALLFQYLSSRNDDDRDLLKASSEELEDLRKHINSNDCDGNEAKQREIVDLDARMNKTREAIRDRAEEMLALAKLREKIDRAKESDAEQDLGTGHDNPQGGTRGKKRRGVRGVRGGRGRGRGAMGGDKPRGGKAPQDPDAEDSDSGKPPFCQR